MLSCVAALACLPAPSAPAATLRISVMPEWSGRPLAIESAAVLNRAGQEVRISRISALFSAFALQLADGSTVALPGQYAYFDAGSQRRSFTLRNVPPGPYTALAFQVGLAPAVDTAPTDRWPARHPLNPMLNHLYWGWRGGYVFAAIEGWWSRPGTRPEDRSGFSYHLTAAAGPMPVAVAVPIAVQNGITDLRLAFDLAALLRPLRFSEDSASSSSHSRPGDPLAHRLASAIPTAFGFRGMGAAAGLDASAVAAPETASAPPSMLRVPAGFPEPDLPADNLPTEAGVALGAILFRDVRLSGTLTQSCASCHDPARAFTSGSAVDRGVAGRAGRRNSPSLLNLAWNPAFAWDGSRPRIRDQAKAALTGPEEMAAAPQEIVRRLASGTGGSAMAQRFLRAFGSRDISIERITRALEQYLLTLTAADSKFDRAAAGRAALSEEEKHGMKLFLTEYDPARGQRGADCFHCHGGPLFSDFSYRNNGLPPASARAADDGRAEVTHRDSDAGKFKTPSLRNVAITGPYMHDGRYRTLAEVIAHYNTGVHHGATLDPNLAKHPRDGLKLSPADQSALIAFLKTLTDATYQPLTSAGSAASRPSNPDRRGSLPRT